MSGMADAAPAAAAAAAAQPPAAAPALGKRHAALHVGYVGSAFKGSMVNRTLGEGATVEHALELAMAAAGMIDARNVGDFSKACALAGWRQGGGCAAFHDW
jgi:tRNA pseudouridine38-40 synthase